MNTLCLLAFLFADAPAAAVPPELRNYVTKADDAYAWKLVETVVEGGNTIVKLKLTSQKWQGEVWEHDVQIYTPNGVKPTKTMLLYNTGGTANGAMNAVGLALAQMTQSPVVFLFGIPKQPLYGKKEDALIAETFVKYLETKDAEWPLLFPMVKSVVKCMDAVQAFAKEAWKHDVTGFVITGASKRGWTTYLTAATGDPRVKAIAPMVFDSLNMREQMPHQVKSFGGYSAMIKDYQDRKLLPLPDTAEAKRLWAMVDPWVYREQLTLPKLLILGTNDPYWSRDALNLYWNDLKGPKAVLYVPNAGHDLRPMDDPSKEKPIRELFPMKAIDTLAAFTRCIISGVKFPEVSVPGTANAGNRIRSYLVTSSEKETAKRNWKTKSESLDFRKAKWVADTLFTNEGNSIIVQCPPDEQSTATFTEMDFDIEGMKFSLSSPVLINSK